MKRRRRENTGDALLIYTVLATPIPPPIHTRATHICTHTHICAHNHATHTTFSYATGARNRHPFQDQDIRSEVTTLFPRSRHLEWCQGNCHPDGTCHGICLPDEECQRISLLDAECQGKCRPDTHAMASDFWMCSVRALAIRTQRVTYRRRVSRQMSSGRRLPRHLASGRRVSGH